jgi:hypothetical protein
MLHDSGYLRLKVSTLGIRRLVLIFVVFRGYANTPRFNDNTAALSCRQMMDRWLNNCNNDHDTCKADRTSFQPTRLLDLGDVDTTQVIRLVDSKDIDPTARYVTLSHCWGALPPFQLTTETEERMRNGFGYDELPRTFQDAIKVAGWVQGESLPPC